MTLEGDGVNVAVAARHASGVELCLFEADVEVARFRLPHRLGDVHYGFVHGVGADARYGLRAEGPWAPEHGHCYDYSKLLLDPYAVAIDRPYAYDAALARRGHDTAGLVPKAIVTPPAAETATPLAPARPRLVYEIPVRAFTMLHPLVPAEKRGTVAALAEPCILEHLLRLGVDTVELMPLAAWIDERHLAALGLRNAWGYNPVGFMAPDPRLAPGGLAEIRDAVSALHGAGIRVLLDVVFNHSGESDAEGPTLSLRGLDNALYYRHADGRLVNDTGCGNTLALDERPVTQLAMDAMRSWATRTGIDGFRFDLASVLGRRAAGFDPNAPLLAAIEQDPLLSRLTMIAEPWDVGPGGYRLGGFPPRWQEWNDRYRDDVRRFWRGDAKAAGALATRISGSSDIFAPHRPPSASINYVAAHDGFTLRDTVTYTLKNNHANGEGNRDGSAHEPTWPGGDVRALLATLFVSRGTPMLTAGDEFGRTQRGNNNAYAQDNETTWLDWVAADESLIACVADLSRLRRELPLVASDRFLTGSGRPGVEPDARWFGADGPIDWHDPEAGVLGLVLSDDAERMALWFNRTLLPVAPPAGPRAGHRWSRVFCSAEGANVPPRCVAVFREEALRGTAAADDAVKTLAARAGIAGEWWEVDGTHHAVTAETLRALLAGLDLAASSASDVAESARQLDLRPRAAIGRAGEMVRFGAAAPLRRRFVLADEDGNRTEVDVAPGMAAEARLQPGVYEARDEARPADSRLVIVSPGACHLPDDMAAGRRVFGLAAHLYALRHKGGEGIGDFATLRRFARMTATCGGRYSGINPLHHMFPSDRSRVSPYQPSDRRFVDPIYISIADLLERFPLPDAARLAQGSRAAFAALDALGHVDYKAVWEAKSPILEAAFAGFPANADFEAHVRQHGEALQRHGAFEARLAGEDETQKRIRYRAFLQWLADLQLGAAAHDTLYRDLAVGCAFDGGEFAAAPGHFASGVSIGAPPDPFSAMGQVWNLPPFSPLALERRHFAPMRAILAANMRHAAALRIDHVLGFARQFWVPRGAEGRHGSYVRFPADALIALTALESRRQRCLVVGEDLGTVPEGLRDSLAAAGILSYRVLWFEREGLGFRPPEDYPALALACLASHDLPTFKGWRAGLDIAASRALGQIADDGEAALAQQRLEEIRLLDRASGAEPGDDPLVAAHRMVARTPSLVMLVQADDLASESEPLNVPGTDRERPNWRRRISVAVEDLAETPAAAAVLDAVRTERP